MVLLFTGWGEGKCEINYKKKKKIFLLQGSFSPYLVVTLPKKMIGNSFSRTRNGKVEKVHKKIIFIPFFSKFFPPYAPRCEFPT